MGRGRVWFVDTNVLLSACTEDRGNYRACLQLLKDGLKGKLSLYTSGQVFREFLVVATRPLSVNGLGMPPYQALSNLKEFSRCLRLLEETGAVSGHLRKLVMDYNLQGKHIHDANLVATMYVNGMNSLITDNPADFQIFSNIHTLRTEDYI